MKPDPKFSAGARYERAAFRAYLGRLLKRAQKIEMSAGDVLAYSLNWVKERQKRYDKKKGGLGK